MADVTPIVMGACAHKGDPSPTAVCAVSEACGEEYNTRYGEPEAFQTGSGFTRDPVERASFTLGFLLVMATGSEHLWENGWYAEAGPMQVCVSYPFLAVWRCQNGDMGTDGLLRGVGSNALGYDLPK